MSHSSEMSFHVDATVTGVAELQAQLIQLVEASGGQAGILTTWQDAQPDSVCSAKCGFASGQGEKLESIISEEARQTAQGRPIHMDGLRDAVQNESQNLGLSTLHTLVMPVMVGGNTVGVFCLLHPEDAPEFMRKSPQSCNIAFDQADVVVRNAKLLQHLLHERRWFEAMVKESVDSVTILDCNCRVMGLNAAMEKLSGWESSEAAGHPYHEIVTLKGLTDRKFHRHKGSQVTLYRQRNAVDLPITAEPMEATFIDRTGQNIDVEVCSVTVRDDDGRPCGWILIMRDIRARKETERLGKIFLSAMSHELQTPIAVIRGFAGLLADPDFELSMETVRQKASLILEESERLQKMVKQTLEASSIQAGGIVLHCEPVDVPECVGRALRTMENMASAKGVSLIPDVAKHLPLVWADPDRVHQVLVNLIENALKHGAQNGDVTVEAKAVKREVIFSVIDKGPGVSEDDSKRIFGLFQRGAETKVHGSGLGLFICKAVIEAHGGRIGVMQGPGGGACFYFSLPIKKDN